MSTSSPYDTALYRSKILIVDDTETSRLVLSSFCSHAGFDQIREATNGKEALDVILDWNPDLVFLDMQMPVMDGLQLCQELKRRHLHTEIIIIMQTVVEKPAFKTQAFEAGVTDLIAKPLDARETIARMMAHLERKYLRTRTEAAYQRIQNELQEAMMLQNILLPQDAHLATIKAQLGVDIAHYYHPASELAGDYLSVRSLHQDRIALIAADVSGHGLSAALYAFSIHTLLDHALLNEHTPAEVLSQLNAKLYELMSVGKFATMFLAIVDTKQHQLHYAAAASPAPILFSSGLAKPLNTRGHLLGVQPHATYEHYCVDYQPGDLLFIYSDALIETPSTSGDCLTEGQLTAQLESLHAHDASHILRNVLITFHEHYSRSPTDDLSMLACKL